MTPDNRLGKILGRGAAIAAIGVAVELFSGSPTQVAASRPSTDIEQTFQKMTSDPENFFGDLGKGIGGLRSSVFECITDFYLKTFTGPGESGQIRGRKLIVFNGGNPAGAVEMEITSDQAYRGTGRGRDTYDTNTRDFVSGADHARLVGPALTDPNCGPQKPEECKKTELVLEERTDTEIKSSVLVVECPSNRVCVAWGNYQMELKQQQPTAKPTSTEIPYVPPVENTPTSAPAPVQEPASTRTVPSY